MRAVVAAELAKIRTVRSTLATLAPALFVAIGLAWLLGFAWRPAKLPGDMREHFDPLFPAFYGLTLAQLPMVVFGVLAVGSEYGSGMIRASLLAVPRRGRFYAAKVLATAVPLAVVAVVCALGDLLASQAALGDAGVTLASPGAAGAVAGATLHLLLIGLFAVGIATMLRGSVRTLAVLLPLFFLGSQGLGNVPGIRVVTQYLPDQVGWVVMHLTQPGSADFGRDYGPWTGIGILAGWAAAAVLGGYLVLRRRDA
ncbi:ABC transporter permease subunit [Luedemannella flava]|uniref:ABC transporter permease subunit n=1 Tax=Luedemannella flava TaxID=349316 RepID=A0ABN2M892_9ACTN